MNFYSRFKNDKEMVILMKKRDTQKSKIRVAIIHQAPIYNDKGGGGNAVRYLAYLITHAYKCNVKIFSLGNKNLITSYAINDIKIQEFVNKGFGGIDQGKLFYRIIDGISLILFNSRISEEKMARNTVTLQSILDYKPDIVIYSSYSLSPFISKIKQKLPGIKIIAYTDSYKQIYIALNTFLSTKLSKFVKIFPPLFTLIKIRYINYNIKLFSSLIKLSDCIIFPTPIDKQETIRYFKVKKCVSYIPILPEASYALKPYVLKSGKNQKFKKHIKIGFLGTYNYLPNKEAIDIILKKIAPKLLDNEFIIAGFGIPIKTINNVKMIGFVNDINDFFSDINVFIAPLISGVGTKTKLLAAIEKNKPIIGTGVAFSGYNAINYFNCIVGRNINDLVNQIKVLEKNKLLYKRLTKNMYTLIPPFNDQIIKFRKIIKNLI